MPRLYTFLIWLGPALVATGLSAQSGTLDPAFAPTGTSFDSSVRNLAVQPDGKVITGGFFSAYDGVARTGIARLNTDGTLDTGFGPVSGGFNGLVTCVALAPDGDILVGGTFTAYDGTARNRVARLNGDGTLDMAFDPGSGFNGPVFALAVQADGKVIVGGSFTTPASAHDGIKRLNTDGTLDGTFGGSGGFNGAVQALSLHTDGRVTAGGTFTTYAGGSCIGVALLSDTGILDPGFAIGTGFNGQVNSVAAVPGGKMVVGGFFTDFNGTSRNRIARINADGSIDAGFDPGTGFDAPTYALAALSSGHLLVGGSFTQFNGTPRSRIARLNSDGTLDTDFDPPGGCSNTVFGLTPTLDETAVYLGGAFLTVNGSGLIRIARLTNCIPTQWFADADDDGFGDAATDTSACAAPLGFVANSSDCDDTQALIGAPFTWYADLDGDGEGDPDAPVMGCTQPPNTSTTNTDCDDTDPEILPFAPCDDGDQFSYFDEIGEDCVCAGQPVRVQVVAWLEGADAGPGETLMTGTLYNAGLIPLQEPYTAMGYSFVNGGGETTSPVWLYPFPGNDELMAVDWVVVELRSEADPAFVVDSRAGLLRRNGIITQPNGINEPRFQVPSGQYFVAVRHRNHLGFVSEALFDFSGPTPPYVDFAFGAAPAMGTDALKSSNGREVMWAGNVDFNRVLRFVGSENDRDPILLRIGGSIPTNEVNGYFLEDVNLDGVVRYVGQNNDRDPILSNIGGTTPSNSRHDQLPEP